MVSFPVNRPIPGPRPSNDPNPPGKPTLPSELENPSSPNPLAPTDTPSTEWSVPAYPTGYGPNITYAAPAPPVESGPPVSAPPPADPRSDKLKDREKGVLASLEKTDYVQISSDGVNTQGFKGPPTVIVSSPKPGKEDKIGLPNGNPVVTIGDKSFEVNPATRENLEKILKDNGVPEGQIKKIADQVLKKNSDVYKTNVSTEMSTANTEVV